MTGGCRWSRPSSGVTRTAATASSYYVIYQSGEVVLVNLGLTCVSLVIDLIQDEALNTRREIVIVFSLLQNL